MILNYSDTESTTAAGTAWNPGQTQTLDRLKLALKCKQKTFVAHPNVQQLLTTIWYNLDQSEAAIFIFL